MCTTDRGGKNLNEILNEDTSLEPTEKESHTKWTTEAEMILLGFLFSRFLLKGRMLASKNVAQRFGLGCVALLWEDCAKILMILTNVLLGESTTERKPSTCWRRLKTLRRVNRLEGGTLLRKRHLQWENRFKGEKLLDNCPEIFDDGVFKISNDHLTELVKKALNERVNNVPFLIRRPSERSLRLMLRQKSSQWGYEETVLLTGIVTERFITFGSLNPITETGEKVSDVTNVWNVMQKQFDQAIRVLEQITSETENDYSVQFITRSSKSILRRFKVLRSIVMKSERDQQEDGNGPDKFFLELVADFRYINQNNMLTGVPLSILDLSQEKHRIRTFLALRKSHCLFL